MLYAWNVQLLSKGPNLTEKKKKHTTKQAFDGCYFPVLFISKADNYVELWQSRWGFQDGMPTHSCNSPIQGVGIASRLKILLKHSHGESRPAKAEL